jgi:rubrerythrin
VVDPDVSPMEACLALETAAIEGFATAAQLEPVQACETAYNYALLDHMTQTKALADKAMEYGLDPQSVIKRQVEPQEGRPFDKQFVHTDDLLKEPVPKGQAGQLSLVNLHTVLASEMHLRNMFQILRQRFSESDWRYLCSMVTAVETEHICMIGSMVDPATTPLEYAMANELAEIRIHRLGLESATSDAAKEVHEHALEEDQEHLEWLSEAYARIERGDPGRFQPTDELFAQPQQSATQYIRQIMPQANMLPKGMGFEKAA